MRFVLLIFVFSFSSLFCQIGKPDLRCIEVLPNNFAKLTWIPPTDPTGQFISYEVYYSQTKFGVYVSANLNITSLNTPTCINTTTIHAQSRVYYFLICRFNNGPQKDSTVSDTLASIFLNAITSSGSKALDLRFNVMHEPPVPGASTTFTLFKEYPASVWNTLAVTSNSFYPDTIDVCRAFISYSVALMDGSGCSSISSKLSGDYVDTKNPEEPYVDSISVLPNGNTCIAWEVPVDRDIVYYRIFYNVTANRYNEKLDSVPGRNSIFYIFNSTSTDSMPTGLFVAAGDSCRKEGTPFYNHATMFLQTAYDHCAYRSVLRWNHYRWYSAPGKLKRTTKEYRIYYSTDSINYVQTGSTKDSVFVHENVQPGSKIFYYVRVVSEGNPITSSSNRARFRSNQTDSPGFVYLSSASVVDKTNNEVRIYIDTSVVFKNLQIQRAQGDTNFKSIGLVAYNGSAYYSFLDPDVETTKRSYSYRVVVRDSCDNPRNVSNISTTMLLRVIENETDMYLKNLSWSAYEGFAGGVRGYNVFRVINDIIDPVPIGSTGTLNLSFVDNLEDVSNKGAKIDYRIQAVEDAGNPYNITENSFSNPYPVYMEGGLFVPNAFAPSGLNSTWLPITYFVEKSEYHVSVFNRWGKKVFETSSDTEAWDGAGCQPDVYVYLIDYKNSRGEYMQIKGNVLILK
ncbi:MAG: gliding motility-associated C-terminal domain-containing protein [Bacteroidia bacterium]|nr:gliding motility-associated C-terminal domain-containing protein [Bacteroidia bacterium]